MAATTAELLKALASSLEGVLKRVNNTQNVPSRWLDIPTEIYEDIFGLLSSASITTLLTCTLVCRDWVAPARNRLFQHKTVLLRPFREGSRGHLTLLPEDIVPGSTLLPHIQQIHILASEKHGTGSYESLNKIITMTHGRLPGLQRLRLFDIHWDLLTADARSAISSYPKLTLLCLRCVVMQDVVELGDALSRMTSLREVQLDGIVFKDKTPTLPCPFSPAPLSLSRLQVEGNKALRSIRPWIASLLKSTLRFESLLMSGSFDEFVDFDAIGKLVLASGDKLQKASLLFKEPLNRSENAPTEHLASYFDFSANKKLKYLEIGTFQTQKPGVTEAFSAICSMLRTFTAIPSSHHLQSLILRLDVPNMSAIDLYSNFIPEWAQLDDVLALLHSTAAERLDLIRIRMPNAQWKESSPSPSPLSSDSDDSEGDTTPPPTPTPTLRARTRTRKRECPMKAAAFSKVNQLAKAKETFFSIP